jgi:hypothetical protein
MSREGLIRRGLRLEYATLGWNLVGTVVLIATAVGAESVALAGFGLDSAIEVFASGVVVWQLKGVTRGARAARPAADRHRVLARRRHVLAQSTRVLIVGAEPDSFAVGTSWVGLTVVVMLALAIREGLHVLVPAPG